MLLGNRKSKNLNISGTIILLAKSWRDISLETIVKCFRHRYLLRNKLNNSVVLCILYVDVEYNRTTYKPDITELYGNQAPTMSNWMYILLRALVCLHT